MKMSKLKHWKRCCKRRVSCIPWQRVAGNLGKELLRFARRRLVVGTVSVGIAVKVEVSIEIKLEIALGILDIAKLAIAILG